VTTATRPTFKIGDRVMDKRDKKRDVAVIDGGVTHSNGSRKWYCAYPDMRIAIWEVDLLHAPKEPK